MENDLNLDKFDVIVRSLRTCANPRDCEYCPYWARFGAQGCDRLEADAADAIQNLLEVIDTWKTLLPSTETLPAVDAVEYELADDGTLEITVPNGTKVGRVLVSESGTHFGGLYYPDAVDAVEVRHGEWIDHCPDNPNDPRMRCSNCTCVSEPLLKWRFCPCCGARMDGRREDGDA